MFTCSSRFDELHMGLVCVLGVRVRVDALKAYNSDVQITLIYVYIGFEDAIAVTIIGIYISCDRIEFHVSLNSRYGNIRS